MKAIEASIVHFERKVTAVILIPMCVAVSLFHNAGCGFHRNIFLHQYLRALQLFPFGHLMQSIKIFPEQGNN